MMTSCQPVRPRYGPPRVRPQNGRGADHPEAGVLVAGRYRLAELAGRGAIANVWRGRDERLGREVAVKQFVEEHPHGVTEAQIAARVRHPNVVAVHDLVRHEGSLGLVMDYHDGGTLAERLHGGRRLRCRSWPLPRSPAGCDRC